MKVSLRYRLLAVVLVVAGVVSFASAQAFAAGTLRATRASGLVQGEVVGVIGSGLAANAYGYVLECNSAPGEPTIAVGAPFNQRIPIGCSRPNLKYIVSTSAAGTLSTSIKVHVSRNLGPPCSVYSVFGPCGGRPDSAGKGPRADAQNFPCPPSPAQQAEGVTCSLVFYDTAHEQVSTPIKFLGSGPVLKTPPTTAPSPIPPVTTPPGGGTTPGGGGGTTPGGGGGTTPGGGGSGTSPAGGGGTTPGTPALTRAGGGSGATGTSSGSPSSTGTGVVKAGSGSLAFTGLGPIGKLLALLGGLFVLVGLVLFFVNVRKVGCWLLGL
jgi:hypothetical protein